MSTLALHPKALKRAAPHARAPFTAWLPRPLQSILARAPLSDAELGPAELAAEQAHDVRRLARTYEKTDPGFAADLYAAAARHEAEGLRQGALDRS